MTSTAVAARDQERSRPRLPELRGPARKTVLTVHVLAAATWIGVDVLVAVLVGLGLLAPDPELGGAALLVLGTAVVPPMLVSALVCLASGLLLGLGTRWGLVRYWWVAVKLVITLVLSTLILVLLRPGMPAVADHGRALLQARPPAGDVSFLVYPPVVSLTALSLAVVLSVAKPWGRVRRALSPRRPSPPRPGAAPSRRSSPPARPR
ncbi:hypothetical protein [Desertihabitans brevis]|uniref:hypothetical protein n=1 Tax=Desertihabitans brevis TaxID=2268447 RepID=UPI0018F2D989|nr:hypothetical protein [Desertihabitans brevis]